MWPAWLGIFSGFAMFSAARAPLVMLLALDLPGVVSPLTIMGPCRVLQCLQNELSHMSHVEPMTCCVLCAFVLCSLAITPQLGTVMLDCMLMLMVALEWGPFRVGAAAASFMDLLRLQLYRAHFCHKAGQPAHTANDHPTRQYHRVHARVN